MARYDGFFEAVREAEPSDVLGAETLEGAGERARQDAIACYLSGSHGWQEAIKLLRGAFAPDEQRHGSGLTSGKAN